ncbi:D-glycero-alpha-D-manno-heptose-1,7-bisphosphate 7-phosphatase [Chitinophaga cymbidii]|uniref:D,D-heptose 1,7-bisphosphate phosphatase n=1 Tax=Chitinophaga cymbidii TaxID=1096750 RepID=A0A512RKH2_9BACT|nr:HAD family hydrolase [Chitinophaga cymbidii]GEP96194.1 D,D-heptose 1,7-bisphosphate phosphatase [Chitinophaga cymbidii]
MRKAVFIDKDGTLVRNVPYNSDPALVTLERGAIEGLQLLHAHGYALVVASNQSGIAHGYFSEEDFLVMMEKMLDMLPVELDGYFYCPHHPEGIVSPYAVTCGCRKPQPGLLLKAAGTLQIDLDMSWMIGDILHDVEAGKRAGCRTVLIDNGGETEWDLSAIRRPDFIASDLLEAATLIIENEDQN